MEKQRVSKKSYKKKSSAKPKRPVSKKSAPKKAAKKAPISGKKNSGVRQVTNYAGEHLDEQLTRMWELINHGWSAEDIQIVLRYKTIGGVVEERGTMELHDAMAVRGIK